MTKLSDLQLVLLTAAAQRPDGNLLPPPASVSVEAARIAKAIPALLKRELVAEADTTDGTRSSREQDERLIGVVITDAGRAAIGFEASSTPADTSAAAVTASEAATDVPKALTKAAQVVALLQRAEGATLGELVAATGWLPHTTRAALTGLRKKGHAIAKSKRDDATCYRIEQAA